MVEANEYSNFEFLTGITYGGREYVGIVVNQDGQILTFYDVEQIPTPEIKRNFLELGEIWWWESNRQIPIDVFLFQELIPFRYAIRTFENKHIEVKFGPVTEINNLVKKRIKRRTITLVKNVPSKDSQ